MHAESQILHSNEPKGEPFNQGTPFNVFLDTYTDGWYLEYAINDENVENKDNLNWKRYHSQPIQEHGELSHVLVYGMPNVLYRVNGGTQGATAFRQSVRVSGL